jgi:stage III sporulation protein AA
MSEFLSGAAYLPPALRDIVAQVPARIQASTQEIRLRAGGPVVLSTPAGDLLVTKTGQVTELSGGGLLVCDRQQLDDCFQRLCEYSVHTHQQEIREGYVSTRSGCRVGLAGSLVVEDGQILSMRQITSLCIRIARRHDGCASALAAELVQGTSLRSALLAGEPSSGKTSLLRDLARQLSSGHLGRRYRVAVVDERGELSAEEGLPDCDVLLHSPKGAGIQQAVRCLAPDVVMFDEIGTMEEVQAVTAGLNAGVSVVASVHGRDPASLLRRPPVRAALESGAFDCVVMLEGRRSPGLWRKVYETGDLLAEGDRPSSDCAGRDWPGRLCGGRPEPARVHP